MNHAEWADITAKIKGLWPAWSATGDQAKAWRAQLTVYHPDWIKEALDRVYAEFASKEPSLKWVLQMTRRVRDEQSAQPTDPEQARALAQAEAMQEAQRRAELDAEFAEMVEIVRAHPKALKVRDAVLWRRKGMFGSLYTDGRNNQSDDPIDWSRMLVGFTWSAITHPGDFPFLKQYAEHLNRTEASV